MMNKPFPRASVLNFPVDLSTLPQGVDWVCSTIEAGESLRVVTLNPEMIIQGEKQPSLGQFLKQAELIIPDGAGVVWALKRQGISIQRVPGIEFSEGLLAQAAEKGYRVALIGAKPETLETTTAALKHRYPGIHFVFTHHGYFESPTHRQTVAEACAQERPQIVLVALGVPKQEEWVDEFQTLFEGSVFVGVGGSFDVWSGTTQRAPQIFQKLNLEWFYRLLKEPWRWQRLYQTLPVFVIKVWMRSPL